MVHKDVEIKKRCNMCIVYIYRLEYACAAHIPVAMLSNLLSLHLFKVIALSWSLETSTATSCTIENNWERLPGDAPLPPNLMKINSFFLAGENGGNFRHQLLCCNLIYFLRCSFTPVPGTWSVIFFWPLCLMTFLTSLI